MLWSGFRLGLGLRVRVKVTIESEETVEAAVGGRILFSEETEVPLANGGGSVTCAFEVVGCCAQIQR